MAVQAAPYLMNAQLLLEHLLSTCHMPVLPGTQHVGSPLLVPQLPTVSLIQATQPPPGP